MKIDLYEMQTDAGDGADTGGAGDGADRPDYLLAKFATAEDQAKAYAEAEKEMARLRTQAATDREQFDAALERIEAVQTQQQQQFQPPAGLDPQTQADLAAYQQALEAGDGAAQLAISLSLNQRMLAPMLDERFATLKPTLDTQSQADRNIAFELAQERVGKLYGEDWKELQPEVQTWLNEHQSWLPVENDPSKFEQVIREGAQTIVNAKAAERLAAFEADRQAKLGAQTAAGSGSGRHSTVGDDKATQWQEVAGADIASYGQIRSGS